MSVPVGPKATIWVSGPNGSPAGTKTAKHEIGITRAACPVARSCGELAMAAAANTAAATTPVTNAKALAVTPSPCS